MSDKTHRASNRAAENPKLTEHYGSLPGQAANVDVAADSLHRRMAEYCERASAPFKPAESAQSLVHEGEFYLPGVF